MLAQVQPCLDKQQQHPEPQLVEAENNIQMQTYMRGCFRQDLTRLSLTTFGM